MDSEILLDMMEKENLLPIIKKNSNIIKKILKKCLNAKTEKVLLIGDKGFINRRLSPMLTTTYMNAAEKIGLETKTIIEKPKNKGEIAEKKVLKALLNQEEKSIVISNMSKSLGNLSNVTKSFRGTMRQKMNKFTSMSSLESLNNQYYDLIMQTINIDYKKLQKRAEKLKKLLDNGNTIKITTEAGTNLKMNIKKCISIANDGKYDSPGKGGNMPTGEVYIPPNNISVNGKVIIDGSIRHRKGTLLIKNPVKIEIKKGKITKISDNKEGKTLKETLEWASAKAKKPENVWKIAELGIGINPKCKIIGQCTIDEKTLGTCHIANGSNKWFGGKISSIIHMDHILRNPSITIDKKETMTNGTPIEF